MPRTAAQLREIPPAVIGIVTLACSTNDDLIPNGRCYTWESTLRGVTSRAEVKRSDVLRGLQLGLLEPQLGGQVAASDEAPRVLLQLSALLALDKLTAEERAALVLG